MTREQFIAKYRYPLAGLALFGVTSETKDGPMKRATHALELPETVEKWLGSMFDAMLRDLPEANPNPVTPVTSSRKAG